MRDKLLPPNYTDLAVWKDLADAIDVVFKDRIDNPQKLFFLLRDTFSYRYTEYGSEPATGLFDITNLFPFDKEEVIRVNNLLGFTFSDSLISLPAYQNISSNIAMYYPQSGTPAFADFFGYAIDAQFKVENLWAEQPGPTYNSFLVEGDPGIGTPVYEGGTWYPTAHVYITYDIIKFPFFTPYYIKDFFYYVAPLNIVLQAVTAEAIFEVEMPLAMFGTLEIYY